VTNAYEGLVPRKPGEFHHHFEGSLSSPCVICGGSVGLTPCLGPQWRAWEARMQERHDLKEAIFGLIYGAYVPAEKREQAAAGMAEFDAETLRMFPERFREPNAEELQRRADIEAILVSFRARVVSRAAADVFRVEEA